MTHDLVLIPGVLNTGRLYHHQVRALEGFANVHIGNTLAGDDTINAMAKRILNDAPDKFALGGMSMGGYIALEIMSLAPERVTHLALMNTHAQGDSVKRMSIREKNLKAIKACQQKGRFIGVSRMVMRGLISAESLKNKDITTDIRQMAQDVGRDLFIQQQYAIIGRTCKMDLLPKITIPTLLVMGDEDKVIPRQSNEEMIKHLTNCPLSFEILRNCGHVSPLEHPETIAHSLMDLLKR